MKIVAVGTLSERFGPVRLVALSDHGSFHVLDTWFADERGCHFDNMEIWAMPGMDLREVQESAHRADVAYIRSWV